MLFAGGKIDKQKKEKEKEKIKGKENPS